METEPANTIGYFIGGYAVIFGTMLVYFVSLIVRARNLKQDEALLRDLDKENR